MELLHFKEEPLPNRYSSAFTRYWVLVRDPNVCMAWNTVINTMTVFGQLQQDEVLEMMLLATMMQALTGKIKKN